MEETTNFESILTSLDNGIKIATDTTAVTITSIVRCNSCLNSLNYTDIKRHLSFDGFCISYPTAITLDNCRFCVVDQNIKEHILLHALSLFLLTSLPLNILFSGKSAYGMGVVCHTQSSLRFVADSIDRQLMILTQHFKIEKIKLIVKNKIAYCKSHRIKVLVYITIGFVEDDSEAVKKEIQLMSNDNRTIYYMKKAVGCRLHMFFIK